MFYYILVGYLTVYHTKKYILVKGFYNPLHSHSISSPGLVNTDVSCSARIFCLGWTISCSLDQHSWTKPMCPKTCMFSNLLHCVLLVLFIVFALLWNNRYLLHSVEKDYLKHTLFSCRTHDKSDVAHVNCVGIGLVVSVFYWFK